MPSTRERFDAYQAVTDQIVAALERGVVPWRQPWTGGTHRNLVSRRPYRGANQLLLGLSHFERPWWLTLKQANSLGGRVRKGETSTLVCFWWLLRVLAKPGEWAEVDGTRTIWMLRVYRVFNVAQVDGIDDHVPAAPQPRDVERIEACERLVAGMPDPPTITHGGSSAFYRPADDHVQVPDRGRFESAEAYYCVLLHELAHATGHQRRLARPEITNATGAFGDEDYSREELVAEIGAAMLCAVTGISPATIEASAAYVDHWLGALRGDKRLVVSASAHAQRAADYVTGDHDASDAARDVPLAVAE